jgi:hypothetical protein
VDAFLRLVNEQNNHSYRMFQAFMAATASRPIQPGFSADSQQNPPSTSANGGRATKLMPDSEPEVIDLVSDSEPEVINDVSDSDEDLAAPDTTAKRDRNRKGYIGTRRECLLIAWQNPAFHTICHLVA